MSRWGTLVVTVVVVLLLAGSTFVVSEGESALVIRLGEAIRKPIVRPGLYWKLPLLDDVIRFDARIISWDGEPERIPVKDSKFIFVDTFARWRITNPLRFYNAVKDEKGAQGRLDDILDGSVRDVVSTHYLLELVRTTSRPLARPQQQEEGQDKAIQQALNVDGATGGSGLIGDQKATAGESNMGGDQQVGGKRLEVRQAIFDICARKLKELNLGIELLDLRIKRIEYTEQVRDQVYRRMVSEQSRIAERYRAQGQGKKAEIAGLTSQEQRRIESQSYRTAQEILGQAEAESTRVYAEAYNQDADFYRFLKTLETYKTILKPDGGLILSTDSELLHYLKTPH
ncbi:MAG TPA: protease modulator HflC [Thermoanaerobaculia bacterium]|nr:protease modulator HflC [Thermoanaerobaculia bacterium]